MKRALDVIVASVALVLLAPLMVCLALLIRLRVGSPVFFRQARPGLKGKPFNIIKYRTMKDGSRADGTRLSDAERITPLGRFLRSTSLDELPELWNVLVGEMSIVGPRPLLMQYLPLYTDEQRRRHDVRPGITGWAQIRGRNAITWEQKFELDVWYVDNRSMRLDLAIILLTIWKVLRREGISPAGEAIMPSFVGSLPNNQDGAATADEVEPPR